MTNFNHRRLAFIAFILLLPFFSSCDKNEIEVKRSLIRTDRIYGDGNTYCSFTSMVINDGVWYLAFREGPAHVSDYAIIRILYSSDGISWQLGQTLSSDNTDLRDPNLSVMPDGRIMMICGARRRDDNGSYYTKTFYSIFEGDSFSDVKPICLPEEIDDVPCSWLWRLTWNGNVGYGAVYRNDGYSNTLTLVKTYDGVSYEVITELEVGRIINETRIRFLKDQTMVALMRSDENGFIGVSKPPYTRWEMKRLDIYLAGQDFIFDQDWMICATRRRDPDGEKTVVYFGNQNGEFDDIIELPSYGIGGDTSYPSIINQGDYYYVSYYSMHETEKPCIYLSKIAKGTRRY